MYVPFLSTTYNTFCGAFSPVATSEHEIAKCGSSVVGERDGCDAGAQVAMGRSQDGRERE